MMQGDVLYIMSYMSCVQSKIASPTIDGISLSIQKRTKNWDTDFTIEHHTDIVTTTQGYSRDIGGILFSSTGYRFTERTCMIPDGTTPVSIGYGINAEKISLGHRCLLQDIA